MEMRELKGFLNDPIQLLSEKCKRSFFNFVVEFWDQVVNDPPFYNWHIPYLCGEMTKLIQGVVERRPREYDLVINVPPGSTKSLLTTVFFPPWCWSQWPYLKFIKTSYSSTLSMEHAEVCRDLVRSEKYQSLFPYIRIKRDKDKKSNFKIQYCNERGIWKSGGNLFSTSVEGTVTGFHAHFLLTDDPIDPFKAYSKTQLENVNRWLTQVLPTRKVEKGIVPHVMIMQRVDVNDPSANLLNLRKKGYSVRHVCLPGRARSKAEKLMVEPKSLLKFYNKQNGYLDPIRLNEITMHDLELNLGQYGFLAQVQQNPLAAEKGMFQTSEISIVNLDTFNLPPKVIRIIRYWDKAGTKDGGTWTCGTKMAQLKHGRYIILDIERGQWNAPERESVIDAVANSDGNQVTQIVEQEPGSGGKESAYNTKTRLTEQGIKCLLDRPTGDKVYRADPLSVAVNRGLVFMAEAPWNQDALDEMRRFPAGDRDQVDSMSGAYGRLSFTKRIGTW